MLLPSVRRIALSDVNEDVLRRLVEHGESLYVERKREPPQEPKFGRAVASFANLLGGFVLLGVDDDGGLHGWEPPEGVDLQSHLGELLRNQVDPLPPYIAEMRELDGHQIGVVRVFESVDTPHVVRGTGSIVVRSSKAMSRWRWTTIGLCSRWPDAARRPSARHMTDSLRPRRWPRCSLA